MGGRSSFLADVGVEGWGRRVVLWRHGRGVGEGPGGSPPAVTVAVEMTEKEQDDE